MLSSRGGMLAPVKVDAEAPRDKRAKDSLRREQRAHLEGGCGAVVIATSTTMRSRF